MKINLITHLNGVGLEYDAKLIGAILESAGHEVDIVNFQSHSKAADLAIFFEILENAPRHLAKVRKSAFIPNPEWFMGWVGACGEMDEVWIKSQSCYKPFKHLNRKTKRIGFTSRNMYVESVDKKPEFFHLAGKSGAKNTMLVLQAWAANPKFPKLTVVVHHTKAGAFMPFKKYPNIHLVHKWVTDNDLKRLMNESAFHLCPSSVEGWGHYIVEGMSTGAVVLTTNGPPMNDHINKDRGILIEKTGQSVINKAISYRTDYGKISEAVKKAISMPVDEVGRIGNNAREWYLENHKRFVGEFLSSVNGLMK